MPYSNIEQITPIMQEILRNRPRRLIDVGCGLGVYGILSRIQLDLYFDENFYKKIFRKYKPEHQEWETIIDAVEGFSDYLDYIPSWVYNKVIVDDVRLALPSIPDNSYDMALALAIIEHLSREDGLSFIKNLKRISRKIIISVPKNVGPQSVPDNDFETHRSRWSKEDFISLGFNNFIPHEHAWIPVFDPDYTMYEANQKKLSFEELGTAKDKNLDKLQEVHKDVLSIIEMQNTILERLSIKHRLRSIMRKFRVISF